MEKCDCLNLCGDDSRVAAGMVKPCKRWLRDQAITKDRQRVLYMIDALAKNAIASGSVYVSAQVIDDIWRMVNGLPTSGAEIDKGEKK